MKTKFYYLIISNYMIVLNNYTIRIYKKDIKQKT